MAMQVELGTALASLTNIGELRSETTLQRAFVGPFSDPGAKNGDRADEGAKFANPLRPSTMPPAASRPRLTPRPFSREKSCETFAAVKPPVAAAKPEDTTAKVSTGNVPPLLDQKLIENKTSKELVTDIPFYPTPSANTVILFETASHENGKLRANPDKAFAVSGVQQASLSSPKSETSYSKPEAVYRPAESRTPPRKSLERKDTFSGSDGVGKYPTDAESRPKPRPVSAIFLESLKDQKPSGVALPDETKPVPEKPWGRKPRPLSMDLTAKFENLSAQKRSRPPESKETPGLSAADSSKPDPTVAGDESKAATPIRKSAPDESTSRVSARKNPWERGSAVAEISDQKEVPPSKERTVLNRDESRFGIENAADPPDVGNKASKGVKKMADIPDSSANAESLPETRVMNIQQRIKELTGDNADLKPGNFRRSFRTRPLPSDLTKLFSVSPTGAETRPEKQTEATRRAPNDIQEKERTPQCGGEETRETGNPWKPQQIAKTTFADERPDKDGRSVKERQSASVPQGDGPASTTIRNVKSPENAAVKTVRATMFEHNVERHTVMANHFATEPTKPQPTSDPTTGQSGHFRESWVEKVLDAKVTSRKVSDAATDAEKARKTRPVNEDKTPWEKRVSKERCDKTPPKPAEDSLVYQRIEPRYEILQTIGERVQSEAIATAPEDKAVTLRSRRSLKERRRTEGAVAADAVWARSLDVRDRKEEIPVPKGKDPGESAVKATPTRDTKGSSHERVTEVNRSWSGQHAATARPSYFGNRNADWERTEEKVSKPSAGTDKGRRDATLVGKTKEGSGTAKKFPEDFGGEPSRIEVCESSASVTGERESETNSRRTTQRPPKTSGQDESTVSDRGAKGGDEFRETDADEGVGKRGRGASPPKPVERWRRKTLPHDAFRTEEARERGKSPSRRDSFQFWDGSVAKRSDKPGPESGPKNELSPSDSKATYFALTYQIPDGNENTPRKASDPIKTQHVSPLAGDASVPPSAGVAKTSSPGNRFSNKQGSLDRDPGRNGGDGDSSEIPQRGLFKYPLTAGKNESQNWDKESAGEVGFPIHGSGAKSPSRLSSGQKKSNDPNYRGVSKDKSADGYRSRVLDLDALMAEYKEDAKKASLIQGNLPEESNAFSREKMSHQRHAADKTPCGYAQKKSDVSPGIAGEKETLESVNRETLKTRDGKRSPPRWGRQAAEKPADRAGAWKKTFIVDEEEGADLVRRHQTAKQMDYSAEFGSPVGADVDLVARPSRLIEGARWKGTRLKRETTVRKEVDTRADTNMSLFGKCDASAAKSGQEPRTVGTGFANAPPDLRRSYSEKVRQSRARGAGFPFGEKVEDRRSVPLETAEDSLEKWSASPHGVLLSDGKKPEVEKDGTKSDREGPLMKNSPYSLLQRRSRSFYRERRTDHWATDQLKQCFGRPAGDAKDTDTLVQETENQYGTWQDQPQSADSFVLESPSSESVSAPARKPTSGSSRLSSFSSSHTDPTSAADPPDASRDRHGASPDRDSTDAESAELAAPSGTSPDFSFLDQTPVLDSSALKTRVQLSKRRRQRRTPISNSLRRSGGVEEGQPRTAEKGETDSAWMFKDSSTGEKPSRRGESDEEGGPRPPERSPAPQTQRLPVFPGMDHSAFKAQLRKRHEPEGTAGTGSGVSAQSRSPKSPFHAGVGVLPGSRMLPTGTETEERRSEEVSPQWLKELKSKKRQSQYENQV